MAIRPDFFIIGMPKSGTSSLCSWLSAHPEIASSDPKETFFFMDREHPLYRRYGRAVQDDGLEALAHFFDKDDNSRVRFEGTTHSFYQETARQYLTAKDWQPLIVVLLREPAARLLSSFRFTRDNLANCDKSLSFDQYVDWLLADETDKLDRFFNSENSLWIGKRELQLGKYVQWLDWWRERIPAQCVHLELFERLRTDPAGSTQELCKRVGVDTHFYDTYAFTRHNTTQAVGRQGVHRLARRLQPLLPRGRVYEYLKRGYTRWQGGAAEEDHGYTEGLERMRAYFAPWNRELAERYQLDLAYWWGEHGLSEGTHCNRVSAK